MREKKRYEKSILTQCNIMIAIQTANDVSLTVWFVLLFKIRPEKSDAISRYALRNLNVYDNRNSYSARRLAPARAAVKNHAGKKVMRKSICVAKPKCDMIIAIHTPDVSLRLVSLSKKKKTKKKRREK